MQSTCSKLGKKFNMDFQENIYHTVRKKKFKATSLSFSKKNRKEIKFVQQISNYLITKKVFKLLPWLPISHKYNNVLCTG